MAVYVANLQINQGADFSQTFNLANTIGDTSFNLTGYAVEAKMKKHAAAAATTATTFTCTIENATNGTISLALSASQTDALKAGRHVYDIVIQENSGNFLKTRVIEGSVLVREGVT